VMRIKTQGYLYACRTSSVIMMLGLSEYIANFYIVLHVEFVIFYIALSVIAALINA
jgi:hypothetical protein